MLAGNPATLLLCHALATAQARLLGLLQQLLSQHCPGSTMQEAQGLQKGQRHAKFAHLDMHVGMRAPGRACWLAAPDAQPHVAHQC